MEQAYSYIPEPALHLILRIIETRSAEIVEKWIAFFSEADFYC